MQNTTILIKCVGELKKDTPNISYILGMLETVIAMSGNNNGGYVESITVPTTAHVQPIQEKTTEELIAGAITGIGPIGNLTQS